jgi:hypothetical protein
MIFLIANHLGLSLLASESSMMLSSPSEVPVVTEAFSGASSTSILSSSLSQTDERGDREKGSEKAGGIAKRIFFPCGRRRS